MAHHRAAPAGVNSSPAGVGRLSVPPAKAHVGFAGGSDGLKERQRNLIP
jgi:hypothetical protein